jgi:hypothetical protein
MRPILLSAVAVLLCISMVKAQEMDFGLKGGLNIGTPIGAAEKGASGSLGVGPMIGMYFAYDLGSKWALHGEFLYSYKGAKFNTPVSGDTIYQYYAITPAGDSISAEANTIYRGTVDGKFDNRYIDIPLYASYALSKRFRLTFGGYVSYLIKGTNTGSADVEVGDPNYPFTTVNDEPFDQSSELSKVDYGLLLGTTYMTKHRLNFGVSVTTGLKSIYKKNYKYIDGVVRNVYLQTFVQFRLNNRNNN